MKRWGLVVVCVCAQLMSVCAEMRIWTSTKGDIVEAEFVSMMGSKAVLKKASDGKILKVSVTGLCAKDREYLANAIPPRIEIDVNVKKDRDTLSSYSSDYGSYNYERKSETIKCIATLEKKNREPTNRKFKARMLVIGGATNRSVKKVLASAEHKFDFKHAKSTHFASSPVTVEYTKSDYASEGGWRYEGYIVYIEDENGKVFAVESSRGGYEKNLHKLKKLSDDDEMDDDCDAVDASGRKKRRN